MKMFLIYLVLQGSFLWSRPPPSERGEGTLASAPAAPKQLEHWPEELHDACGQFDLHSERWRMYVRGSFCPRLINENVTNDAVPHGLMSHSFSVLNNASMHLQLHKPLKDFIAETFNLVLQTCNSS